MTAVAWLTEELRKQFGIAFSNNILAEAKEMEMHQIQNAFYRGIQEGQERTISDGLFFKTSPEQDYNETFNK